MIIFILLLVNRKDLMGEYTNTLTFNIIAWITAIAMIVLTFVLVLIHSQALHGPRICNIWQTSSRNLLYCTVKLDFRVILPVLIP